jgi:hypothetical protein
MASAARMRRIPRPPTPKPVSSARPGQGGAAVIHRPCADGEPQRLNRRRSGHARFGPCRAASGAGAERAGCLPAAADFVRCRQGYDAREFVMELLEKAVAPHVATNTSDRRSAIGGRITRRFQLCCLPAHSQTRGRSFDYGPPRAVARLRDDFPGRAARCRRVCRCERFDPWPNIGC